MSPGGDAEVARIVKGTVAPGSRVLDFGCGVGGASVALSKLGIASSIVSVDIEASVLAHARQLAEDAGVDDLIEWRQIKPGKLPFPDQSFDYVYANSVTCHIEDLEAMAADVKRVITPGGQFIGSEWYVGDNLSIFESWNKLLKEQGLNFHFIPRSVFAAKLKSGGFPTIKFCDRTDAITQIAIEGQEKVVTEYRESLVTDLGEENFNAFSRWGELRAEVLKSGGMQHGHFFAK